MDFIDNSTAAPTQLRIMKYILSLVVAAALFLQGHSLPASSSLEVNPVMYGLLILEH